MSCIAVGGVRLPDLALPLGTHAYTAFAATKAQRESSGDARPSIAERYRNRDDYVNRIRIATLELINAGFLLPEDAAVVIQAAAANPAFGQPAADPAPR